MKKELKKRILITGGAGFIGSSVILELQDMHDITCIGRGTGFGKFKKFANKNVAFVKGDISDKTFVARHMKDIDVIIHLAGGGGNSACITDPEWALDTHIRGTSVLVELAKKHKVKKFIFASSYWVYGSPESRSASVKETGKRAPQSFYAGLKTVAEDIIARSSLNYEIIRFSNVYGYTPVYRLPRMGAINNFIRACLEGKSMRIQGAGAQTTDYLHIHDAVRAIIAVLEKGKNKSVYNIGSGNTVSISALARKIQGAYKALHKKNARIVKIGEVMVSGSSVRMSIHKARKELGWKPKVKLEAGIIELMLNNKPV